MLLSYMLQNLHSSEFVCFRTNLHQSPHASIQHASVLAFDSVFDQGGQCTDYEYMISGKHEYLMIGSSERLRDYKFFIALSVCKYFCFSSSTHLSPDLP
jgi:hypothetical protein